MARVGALIAGIGAYCYQDGGGLPPLKYASADADGIETYIRTCWPMQNEAVIERVKENLATTEEMEAGFARLAKGGPYDLQIIFLSGHGLADPDPIGFLVQPSQPNAAHCLLSPNMLDSMLAFSPAKRTVFILDCCYSEGIVRRMNYFGSLKGDLARLYVVSSRETQRTWEDDGAKHGVFTAHLLDLLNTGSSSKFKGVRDTLDVDGELFPVLCDQVPLYVLGHKQAEQEPVKGGVASAAVSFPVARAVRYIRERTPLATALLRIRQIASGIFATTALFLLFAYTMLYYVEPDPSGLLTVRHGTRWLEPVFKILPTVRVDTGIEISELSPNPAASYTLQAGYSTGVWTHLTPDGYRGWYDTISAGLSPALAARYDVLIGKAIISPTAKFNADTRPADVEFAAWTALATDSVSSLDPILQQLPGSNRLVAPAVSTFDPNEMDFNVLDRSAADMENFARALDYAAALDPERTLPAYIGFVKATQEWLNHNHDLSRGRDARAHVRDAVADGLGVIARARVDRGMSGLDRPTIALLEELSSRGYAEVIDAALSRINGTPYSHAAAVRTLALFHGDPNDPDQGKMLEAISISLDSSPASKTVVENVYHRFEQAGNLENGSLSRFLIAAADARALSEALVSELVREGRTGLSKPERDFMDSERARILSHAMSQVAVVDRPDIYHLIALCAQDVTPMASANAEMYATLGKQHLDKPEMLEFVSAQAHKAKPYVPTDPIVANSPLPGTTIVVGYGPWVAALAQYGRTRELPAGDLQLVRAHLADPALRQIIVKALVFQERFSTMKSPVDVWIGDLGVTPQNAADRKIRQDVIAGVLADMPREKFLDAVVKLRAARNQQIEPEIRLTLGALISDALYWRVSAPDLGSALFD